MNPQRSTIKLTLELAAQQIMSQYQITNEQLEQEIELGVKDAIKNINIAQIVENTVKSSIEEAIKKSTNWYSLRDKIMAKIDSKVDKHIDLIVENLKF